MKTLLSLLTLVFLGACAGPPKPLVVKQFKLRDQVWDKADEPMVRMEKERHLLGAVTMEQRRQRLGQYYTILWQDSAGVGQGKARVVFQYQQGGTASLVKRMTKEFPSTDTGGIAEFAVIGDNYFKNGKVLAWKATVFRGNRELATRQSYLWQ